MERCVFESKVGDFTYVNTFVIAAAPAVADKGMLIVAESLIVRALTFVGKSTHYIPPWFNSLPSSHKAYIRFSAHAGFKTLRPEDHFKSLEIMLTVYCTWQISRLSKAQLTIFVLPLKSALAIGLNDHMSSVEGIIFSLRLRS